MTNPEPDPQDHAQATPSTPGDRPTTDPESRRREFLAKLVAMSFLTAGVLRTSQPARAEQTGQPDPNCAQPVAGGGYSKDEDCGPPPAQDTFDNDCGLPKEGGGRHQDADCTAPPTATTNDRDCNKSTGAGGVHSDERCSPDRFDFDCGKAVQGTTAHTDLNCNTTTASDQACGMSTGSEPNTAQGDQYCPSSAVKDFDCGRFSGSGTDTHSDQDCSTTSQDNDCGESNSTGDSDGCHAEDVDPDDQYPMDPSPPWL